MSDTLSQRCLMLSQRWLTVMIVAAGLLVGAHAAVLSYLIVGMGFLAIFIWRDEHGAFVQPNRVTAVLFAVLFAYAAVSLQWTLNPARAFYDLIIMGLLAIVALQLPAQINDVRVADAERYLLWFAAAFMAGVFLFMLDLSFNLVLQHTIHHVPWAQTLPLALTTRACLCLVLLLWPTLHYFWQRRWRVTAALTWAVLGILTLLSDTAAGRLAFMLSTASFMLAKFSPRAVRVLMAAIIIGGMGAAVPIAQVAQDILQKIPQHMNNSFGHRTEIWKFTAKRILEKPIFGWGFDSARAIPNFGEVSVYQGNDPLKSIIPMHPHNWFLHVLLELGAVGAVMMAVLWLWLLYMTSPLQRSVQPAALAVFSIAMVIGSFSIGLWQSWWLAALIFVGIIVQLSNIRARAVS